MCRGEDALVLNDPLPERVAAEAGQQTIDALGHPRSGRL